MPHTDFENLIDEYGRLVLNVALRILGDADRADDVHQEVFLAIWRRWSRYNGDTNWGAYLYRVTVRKALELAKRSRVGSANSRAHEDPATNVGPDENLRAAELQQRLAECLAGLPQRQADVFVLSRMEGLEHATIAELLGCSPDTVRVHLHRATKSLARQLKSYVA